MDTFVLDLLILLMLKCKSLLEYTNLFSPNDYEKNKEESNEILKILCLNNNIKEYQKNI